MLLEILFVPFHMNTLLTEMFWTKPCACIDVDIGKPITRAICAALDTKHTSPIWASTYDLTYSAIHFNLYNGIRNRVYERIDQFNNKFCMG